MKISMETIEHYLDILRKIGVPNFLAIGIFIIVIWLLISGLKKGLRKKRGEKDSENDDGD